MIKEIQIKNYKGIKELTTLNFELPHLKPAQIEKEPTFLIKDGVKAMATPILLAKNASGKTSILEAIEFADTINSFDELYDWATSHIEKFRAKLNKVFSRNLSDYEVMYYPEWKLEIEKPKVREGVFIIMKRIATDLNFGDIFPDITPEEHDSDYEYNDSLPENHLTIQITKSYLEECQEIFENKIQEEFKNRIDYVLNYFCDSSEENETYIKISFSNGKQKIIKIGRELIFNEKTAELEQLLRKFEKDIESGIYGSKEFDEYYKEYNFARGIAKESVENSPKFVESLLTPKNIDGKREEHVKLSKPFLKVKLINDGIIRNKIKKNNSRNDWGGETLIKGFINYYGIKIAEKVISSIDKSISHIERQNRNNLWILKDEKGVNRSVSDLSFGTFKTIFILNEIYSSWENEKVLLIDEIENGLNMSLINLIVKFATNEKFAEDGFQVIFTTHNPLILSQNVINPQNAFINVSGIFERVIDNKSIIKRSEDLEKVFAPKNYYNEYFWLNSLDEEDKNSSTINRDDIFELLDQVEESLF